MTKWALITGASGGIGQAIAKQLAEEGYQLYLHYNKHKNEVVELQKHLDVGTISVCADLEKESGPTELLSQIHHDIDCIVHNSGYSYVGLVTDLDDHTVKRMTQLHVTSPFLITKHLLTSMIREKCGHIIMITSIWGLTGASCEVLYSMVKGGQNSFVKALAKEVAPSGIKVNGVAPGMINTKMNDHISAEEMNEIAEDIPMGRVGQPEEVANVVRFLLTKQSSYINGQILSVNGAWYT